jgi:site-specific DNA-cytosine methylase
MSDRHLSALHLFCGVGGAALGYQRAGFASVGAFDVDPLACQAFEYLTGEKATQVDLGTMSPDEMRAACTGRPDVVALSPPCKSFSGCLPAKVAATDKYVDLSSLSLRGIWLAIEAWAELPPPLICLENVPRITTRGRHWLDQVTGLLHSYGYAVAETVHDCGELGGLAQRRRRFLMVARHMAQVPDFLRVPPMKTLRGVGDELGKLPVPLPGSKAGGPMHRLPRMSVMNWIRLALIPAGGDWRDLPPAVAIQAGPDRHRGGFGVGEWDEPSKTVVGAADPRHKPVSVADPRLGDRAGRQNGGYGVNDFDQPGHTVVAEGSVQHTWASVQDPRIAGSEHRHNGKYGVEGWDDAAHAVIGEARTGKGWAGVADPRVEASDNRHSSGLGVNEWEDPAHTVVGAGRVRSAWYSMADPRVGKNPRAGVYGITYWNEPAPTVLAAACHDNGAFSLADPRIAQGPGGTCGHAEPRPGCTCGVRRDGSMGIKPWGEPSAPVIGKTLVVNGPWQVADPRILRNVPPRPGVFNVQPGDEPSHTVIASTGHKSRDGAFAVAEPRLDHEPRRGSYGVAGWAVPTHTVRGVQKPQNGEASVADPRVPEILGPPLDVASKKPCHLVIVAEDGTWHRPMTTLELAALQGLPTQINGAWLELPGNDAERRTLIGNAVPPPAAEAIARACAAALREATAFSLSNEDIWVAPTAEALSV